MSVRIISPSTWQASLRDDRAPRQLRPRRSTSDGVQELARADEDLSVGNSRRDQRGVVEIVLTEHRELGSGFNDNGQSVFVGDIDLSVRDDRRSAVGPRPQALSTI